MASRLFIGIMSGTSCDGVDAALVRVDGVGPAMRATFLHLTSVDYTTEDRTLIGLARGENAGLKIISAVENRVAERYVECVRALLAETATPPGAVTALAAHGQTLFHSPPRTVQAFNPTILAGETGIDVVSDFRRADCAAGGQGAPLVPFGDWVMFRADVPRILVNLGGIANLTLLPAGGGLADVVGFDTGPANCLSDWLMRERGGTERGGVDVGGALAATGRVLNDVAAFVLDSQFFKRDGAKSTDTPQMVRLFEAALKRRTEAPLEDKLATANHIAATTAADRIVRWADLQNTAHRQRAEIYVAGGGVYNADMIARLTARCGPLRPTDELGVPTQAREAAAFALLAAAHLDRLPCHMPKVTGALRAVVLGSFTPAPAI